MRGQGSRRCANRWDGCDDWEAEQFRSLRSHYRLPPSGEVVERHLDLLTRGVVDIGRGEGLVAPTAARHLPRLSLVAAAGAVVAGLLLLVSVPIVQGPVDPTAAPAAGSVGGDRTGAAPDDRDRHGEPTPGRHDGDRHGEPATDHGGPFADPATSGVETGVIGSSLSCGGEPATIIGTDGPDRISGTAGADVIAALDGDDQVFGLDGDDIICGGDGDDILSGGGGDDRIGGESGTDTLIGGTGDDQLDGQVGVDTLIPGVR